MVMIERKCVAMEKPLPAEDPMDAEELVDPTFRHDHKVPACPSRAMFQYRRRLSLSNGRTRSC
jgi:hypothetical protein